MLLPVAVRTVAGMVLVPSFWGGALGLATTLLYSFDALLVILLL
jgi:hypothetical protein